MNDTPGLIDAHIELISGTVLPYPATRSQLRQLIHAVTLHSSGKNDANTMSMLSVEQEGTLSYVFVTHVVRVISPVRLT